MANTGHNRERRITIPPDLWESYKYIEADERLKVEPDIRPMITKESIMVQALKMYATAKGHYPLKDG